MANNEVKVIFTGDPKGLFQVADQVEARLKTVFSPATNPGGSVSFAKSVARPYEAASHEIKNITGSISKFLQDEERKRTSQMQKLKRDAEAIKKIQEDIHVPRIIDRRREESPSAFLSPEQRASEAKMRAEIEARIDRQRIETQQKNLRAMEAAEYASNERRLRERARIRHQEFLLDRNAGMTGRRMPTAGEMRYGRLNLARQGADVFTTAAMGMNPGMIAVQQGPQIIEAMAMSGGKFASALTAAKAALVAIGPLLAAGAAAIAVTYKITGDIRTNAENQLRHEEKIAALLGDQLKKRHDIIKSYDDMIRKQQQSFERADQQVRLEKLSDDALRNRAAFLDRMVRFGSGANAEQFGNEVSDINQILRNRELQGRESNLSNRLANEFAILQKQQEYERKRIAETQQKVLDLSKTWQTAVRGVAAQAGSDNPFVKVFFDADDAVTTLKANIKGLPVEMQKAALDSQKAFNARQLFGARIDSTMAAFDLREFAERLRDDTDQRRAFSQGILDRDQDEYRRLLGIGANVNNQAIEESFARRQRLIDLRFRGDTPADRLDRQLKALDNLRPADTGQQALLDQRILRIAQGMNINDLSGSQRERIAQIAERAAEREERRHQEAIDIYKAQLTAQQEIAAYQKSLLERAGGDGDSVRQQLEVTIKNESDAAVETQQPTPQLSAAYYSGQVQYGGWFGNR